MIKKLFAVSTLALLANSFCLAGTDQLDASTLNEKAYSEIQKANITQVYKYANQASALALKNGNPKEQARALSNIASAHFYIGNHQKALNLYLESLSIAENKSDLEGIERALNNISNVYSEIGSFDEALKYRLQLPANNGVKRPPRKKLTALLSLASIYLEMNANDLAKAKIDEAKILLKTQPSPFLKNFSSSYEAKYFLNIGDTQKALSIFQEIMQRADKNEFKAQYLSSLLSQSEIFLQIGELENALNKAQTALSFSKEAKIRHRMRDSHILISQVEKSRLNFRSALSHTEKANALAKEINDDKIRHLAEITKIDRQAAETERKLKQSESDRKIAELKLSAQTQLQIIWTAVILILFSLSFLWYYRKTSRQEIQRQKKVNEELKRLDKVKDRILTNTSHELRTPLNGIVGLSQILLIENEGKLDDESLEHIKLIEKSGNQLSEIVDDILDLAKLRTHFISFKPSEFSLTPLINEVILTCRPLLKNEHVSLQFCQSEEEVLLFHDRTRLKQVLLNLIGNAAKFTPSGKIDVSVNTIKGHVLVKVQDTGIGIPKNMLGRVFQGFEQVDAADNRENGGSGLGLAICSEIVNALNGRINLSSELGTGTIVEVQLPLKYQS